MILEDINVFSALVSLLALVIMWMVVQPLKQSIAALTKATDKLTEALETKTVEINELRERVARVEASASSAHKRIDRLDANYEKRNLE